MGFYDWAYNITSNYPKPLQKFTGNVVGAVGSAINNLGNAAGNILPEFKISENLQRVGGMLTPKTASAAEVDPIQGSAARYGINPNPDVPDTTDDGGGGVVPSGEVKGTSTDGGGSSGPSYQDIMYSQINSGWNNYFNDLDSMLNTTLPAQQTAQTNIANIGTNQQISDLTSTTNQNVASLEGERGTVEKGGVKTLQDIASNIANLMRAGNNYLGAMGASGSAAKQYAYALSRLGSEQRGNAISQTRDLVSKVNDKISQVKNIFTQEKNRIQSELGIKVQEIASWFADAQNQIMTAKANGQLAKSTDLQNLTTNLYNTAVQQLTNIQQQTANKQAMLEEWVANNSKTLGELKSNLSAISSFTAPTMNYNPIGNPFNTQSQQGSQPGVIWGGSAGSGGGSYDDYIKKLLGTA